MIFKNKLAFNQKSIFREDQNLLTDINTANLIIRKTKTAGNSYIFIKITKDYRVEEPHLTFISFVIPIKLLLFKDCQIISSLTLSWLTVYKIVSPMNSMLKTLSNYSRRSFIRLNSVDQNSYHFCPTVLSN